MVAPSFSTTFHTHAVLHAAGHFTRPARSEARATCTGTRCAARRHRSPASSPAYPPSPACWSRRCWSRRSSSAGLRRSTRGAGRSLLTEGAPGEPPEWLSPSQRRRERGGREHRRGDERLLRHRCADARPCDQRRRAVSRSRLHSRRSRSKGHGSPYWASLLKRAQSLPEATERSRACWREATLSKITRLMSSQLPGRTFPTRLHRRSASFPGLPRRRDPEMNGEFR